MKIKCIATGEIFEVRPSWDHPAAAPGEPVWVDRDGISYGRCFRFSVPPGFIDIEDSEMKKLFCFNLKSYISFKSWLYRIQDLEPEERLEPFEYKTFDGLPEYFLVWYTLTTGQNILIIYFAEEVFLTEGQRGSVFKFGKDTLNEIRCEPF